MLDGIDGRDFSDMLTLALSILKSPGTLRHLELRFVVRKDPLRHVRHALPNPSLRFMLEKLGSQLCFSVRILKEFDSKFKRRQLSVPLIDVDDEIGVRIQKELELMGD